MTQSQGRLEHQLELLVLHSKEEKTTGLQKPQLSRSMLN